MSTLETSFAEQIARLRAIDRVQDLVHLYDIDRDLAALGAPAAPLARPLLDDENLRVCAAMLRLLAKIGDASDAPRLASLYREGTSGLLEPALLAWAAVDGPGCWPEIEALLSTEASQRLGWRALAYLRGDDTVVEAARARALEGLRAVGHDLATTEQRKLAALALLRLPIGAADQLDIADECLRKPYLSALPPVLEWFDEPERIGLLVERFTELDTEVQRQLLLLAAAPSRSAALRQALQPVALAALAHPVLVLRIAAATFAGASPGDPDLAAALLQRLATETDPAALRPLLASLLATTPPDTLAEAIAQRPKADREFLARLLREFQPSSDDDPRIASRQEVLGLLSGPRGRTTRR